MVFSPLLHLSGLSSQPFLDVRVEVIAGSPNGKPGHQVCAFLQTSNRAVLSLCLTDVAFSTLIHNRQDGIGANASFCNPRQIFMLDESTLLIADSGSHKIRQLDLRTGMTTLSDNFHRDDCLFMDSLVLDMIN